MIGGNAMVINNNLNKLATSSDPNDRYLSLILMITIIFMFVALVFSIWFNEYKEQNSCKNYKSGFNDCDKYKERNKWK